MRQQRQSPPAGNRRAQDVTDGDIQSVMDLTGNLVDLDTLANRLRGYFVVQVQINEPDRYRTYIYRSLAPVERAVERARSRGMDAHVSLCQLHPVGVVTINPGGVA